MMTKACRLWMIGAAVFLVACGKQAPQRPSQRMGGTPPVDSAQLAMMELNHQMAITADEQLQQYIQAQSETYALYFGNTWVHIVDPGDEHSPQPAYDEEWLIHLRVLDMKEQLLLDSEQTYRIGRCELPVAIDKNITEWHRGTKVRMIAPWYSAYGSQGTADIPSYENVIIDLELK